MVKLAIFLSFCLSAVAQPLTLSDPLISNPIALAVNFLGPTNYGSPIAEWSADNVVLSGTNRVIKLLDSYTNNFALTNLEGSYPWLTNSVLNGHSVVRFQASGGTYLKCDAYSTPSEPYECWMVMMNETTNASGAVYLTGAIASQGYTLLWMPSNTFGLRFGPSTTIYTSNTTFRSFSYVVLTCIYDGNNSSILTNGVLFTTVPGGVNYFWSGLTLGRYGGGGVNSTFSLAQMNTFGATNTPASRLAIFNYYKNKFFPTGLP